LASNQLYFQTSLPYTNVLGAKATASALFAERLLDARLPSAHRNLVGNFYEEFERSLEVFAFLQEGTVYRFLPWQ